MTFWSKMLRLAAVVGVAFILPGITACSTAPQNIDAVLWIGGFAHDFDSAAEILTDALAEQIPLEIEVVRDGSFLDSTGPDRPDVIVMHHCHKSAEGVLTEKQKQQLLELVRGGVGVVAIHASYYSFLEWDEYHELYGARWVTHGPVGVVLTVRTVDGEHPITKDLADSFEVVSELYKSTPLAADCRVLARAAGQGGAEEHPSAWTRRYGRGRVVTILPGHGPEAYRTPDFQKLIASSVAWAAGRRDAVRGTQKESVQ